MGTISQCSSEVLYHPHKVFSQLEKFNQIAGFFGGLGFKWTKELSRQCHFPVLTIVLQCLEPGEHRLMKKGKLYLMVWKNDEDKAHLSKGKESVNGE